MTAQTPAYLKSRFENGDVPQGTDYEDVFDSYVNVATSAEQTMSGNLKTAGQFIGDVSASRITTSALTATTFTADTFITSALRVTTASASTLFADTAKITTVSANEITAATVTAGAIYVSSAWRSFAVNVSALATTQASAILVNAPMVFVIHGDGNNNSVRLPPSSRGLEQKIINASTTALKVFPAVSGRFVTTAVNLSLTVPEGRSMYVFHQGDERYGALVG